MEFLDGPAKERPSHAQDEILEGESLQEPSGQEDQKARMKRIRPFEILTERGKGGRSIDEEFLIDPSDRTLKAPFLALNPSQEEGEKGEWGIDEEDMISSAQARHQKLLPLDHTIPSIDSIIDDIRWRFIHWTCNSDTGFQTLDTRLFYIRN